MYKTGISANSQEAFSANGPHLNVWGFDISAAEFLQQKKTDQRGVYLTQPMVPMVEKFHRSASLGLENLFRLSGQRTSLQHPRQGSVRRDWNTIVCFSCGKAGHSATRCPVLDDLFPFILPGWRAEMTPGGFIMISPHVAAERRRAENGD